jgi:hypothetical protein
MTINDLGSIANLISAVTVVVTLIYLAKQVRQGNVLARYQARQRMMEQTQAELYQWMQYPSLVDSLRSEAGLSDERYVQMHFFLLSAMRQREWEWLQVKDGVIKREVYETYLAVIGLHLGTPRTRRWWTSVGRVGFDPAFAAEVDAFLARQPTIEKYYENITAFERQPVATAAL